MYKMASQANKRAQSEGTPEVHSMALDLTQREAKLLGLVAKTRKPLRDTVDSFAARFSITNRQRVIANDDILFPSSYGVFHYPSEPAAFSAASSAV
jgi:hypothetical protein